jgi:hypothetical protein
VSYWALPALLLTKTVNVPVSKGGGRGGGVMPHTVKIPLFKVSCRHKVNERLPTLPCVATASLLPLLLLLLLLLCMCR